MSPLASTDRARPTKDRAADEKWRADPRPIRRPAYRPAREGWKVEHHAQWVIPSVIRRADPLQAGQQDHHRRRAGGLHPIWTRSPRRRSRLRGRIEAVLASLRSMAGFRRTSRTRRGGELVDRSCRSRRSRNARPSQGDRAEGCPRLHGEAGGDRQRSVAGAANHHPDLRRTSETLGMTFDEIDFDNAFGPSRRRG